MILTKVSNINTGQPTEGMHWAMSRATRVGTLPFDSSTKPATGTDASLPLPPPGEDSGLLYAEGYARVNGGITTYSAWCLDDETVVHPELSQPGTAFFWVALRS